MTVFQYSDAKELLKEIKEFRNDMVAKNYPYQQITNIIHKWEEKLSTPEINISYEYDKDFSYTPYNTSYFDVVETSDAENSDDKESSEWRVAKATLVTGYDGKEKKEDK
tara:strand:- start:184 stop:510 length:327 start_codon:yes stop_codon:yes gene_type:complete